MTIITEDSKAHLKFEMAWQDQDASHLEILHAPMVNFWRDCFPQPMYQALLHRTKGERASFTYKKGELIPAFDPARIVDVRPDQFNRNFRKDMAILPKNGRYYPKGILKDVPNVFPQNMTPFRYLGQEKGLLMADFNHPLSGFDLEITVEVMDISNKQIEKGGSCYDWMEQLTEGPGMQHRPEGMAVDFFSDAPFERTDNRHDDLFYETPRLVSHVDRRASSVIGEIYDNLLEPGMKVLDLMSSWESHLKKETALGHVTGIGMNEQELAKNPHLNDFYIHDLNAHPHLPFSDNAFDAVICSVSVEYLISPFQVFRELARVTRKNGKVIMTFSNRWFPPKAIRIWQEVTEYEREGIVMAYFKETGLYKDLHTKSVRGLPRPIEDKYFRQFRLSDPIFAVWATIA